MFLIALALGTLIQRQLEDNALVQQANEVAVVLQGTTARYLKPTDVSVAAGKAHRSHWTWLAGALLMADHHLVGVKVWDPHGRVIYSNDPGQIGAWYLPNANLRSALNGHRAMSVATLNLTDARRDAQDPQTVLDTYVPIYGWGKVIGAYEAFSNLTSLQPQLDEARRTVWLSVGLGFLALYASLFAIVRRASRRLVQQLRAITAFEVQAREAESLRQVDRLKDEFIGSVSHELRRPLASIKGYTASLLLPDARWDATTQGEFLQVIDEEADNLALLIDNLLDVARLGSGSLALIREPVHLPAIAEQMVRRVRSQPHLPSHPYEIRFPTRFPFIGADPDRMKQLLLNLLENAAKYSPPRTPILVEGRVEGQEIAVSVVDHGSGLNREQAAHVFDKFYRVDSGLTTATEGIGLGLAICRGVVEAHGGQISVTSRPGQGCTFTVRFPVMREEMETASDANPRLAQALPRIAPAQSSEYS